MTVALIVLCASLSAAPADPTVASAPPDVRLALAPAAERAARGVLLHGSTAQTNDSVRVTVADAPASPGASLLASTLTSLTGFASLLGLAVGPEAGMPGSEIVWRARLGASLFLLSAGPSVGDLLNHDTSAFLVSTAARSALAGLSWVAIELTIASPSNGLLVGGTVLLVAAATLVWTGWCAADLVRSIFAPDRWVERTNAQLRSRRPIAEVSPAGGWASAH